MARVRTVGMAAALGLAAAVAGISPAATAGASRTTGPVAPFQSAACGAVPVGYATCLVHVWHRGTPGTAGPQRHHGTTTGGPKNTSPSGYSPTTIATAYGFTRTGGTGETIAVVDAFGAPTLTTDLTTFDAQYNLPQTGWFTKVTQTGNTTYPRTTKGWALETSLDVEWAHALAPNARVLLVEATSNSNANLFAAVQYAAQHANYVSMSWGGNETSTESTYDSTFTSAPGVSFFAAAGDTASQVIYPSSSPDVVSVGGTTLQVMGTGAWTSESAWSTAGGGCSKYEAANPAQATDAQATCGGKRATPDFSLDANPSTGVAVYDTERVTGLSGWIQVGGTSASTVMVASHAAETATPVDATAAYGSSLKFYDVTSGSNGHPCAVGYDLCTGLGSWNTAVGSVTTPPASTGSLSFTTSSVTTTAGNPVQLSVALSAAQTTPVTVSLSTSSSTGEFSASKTGPFSSTLSLTVSTSTSFWYEDTTAGSPTLTASATGWTSATKSVTVNPTGTATSSITVAVSAGTLIHHGHTYRMPLTVKATSGGSALGGASVTLDVYRNGICTGTPAATGTGTTNSTGTASFTFSTHTASASYCAEATVTKSGYSTGTGTTTFTA